MAGAEEVVAAVGPVRRSSRGSSSTSAAGSGSRPRSLVASTSRSPRRRRSTSGTATRPSRKQLSGSSGSSPARTGLPAPRSASRSAVPSRATSNPGIVAGLAQRLVAAGAEELVLADTIGVATPARALIDRAGLVVRRRRRGSLPRYAAHRRRVRVGRGRGGGDRPRRLGGRVRRLPVRAACDRQRRHRGRALPARPRGRRDRCGPRRADLGGEVARGAVGRGLPGRVYRA